MTTIDTTTYRSPNFDARPAGAAVDAIVLHSTEGLMPGTAHWLCNPTSQVSAHYVIARDGAVYNLVPVDNRAWHAGVSVYNGRAEWNDFSIGIELEHVRGSDYPTAQMAALDWLCRHLIATYPIRRDLIAAHRWLAPSRKIDPTDWSDAAIHAFVAGLYDAPPVAAAYDADSPILAAPRADLATVVARFPLTTKQYTTYDVQECILPAYWQQALTVGVDPLLAIAQMAHETGALTSWWSARPRRNPAGIGVTGVPGMGVSFADWVKNSIPAHLGRLLAYATYPADRTPAQHAMVSYALAVRGLPTRYLGCAPTLRGLEGTWAWPGRGYADKVAAWANRLAGL